MFHSKRKTTLLIILSTLVIWGCPSEEYTSAKLYLQQNDLKKAEEFLVKAMVIEIDNPEIPFQLGHHIYGKDGRWAEMNDVFEKALAIDPNRKILGGSTVEKMIEISRYGYWSDVYNKGVKVFNASKGLDGESRNDEVRNAINEFQNGIKIKSDESLNYTMLATCYFELGDADKSSELIIKAVEIAPDDFNANMAAGQIFIRKKQPDKALPYLQKAVELDPKSSAVIRNLAQTYYDLGNTEESIATYEKAIQATVEMKAKADLHFNLGVLYNQVEDYDAAEEHFVSALDLNPEDIEAIMGMAQTFESIGKWRKAEKFYKELIYLDPENSEHYRGISRVLLQQGKQKEAQRYFEKSKKYD